MDLHAVFIRGSSEPVAFFSDADQAQRWRREHHGDQAVVVPVEASVSTSALDAASEAAAASFPAPAASVAASADDVRKGEIRARLEAEERDKRLEEEVRQEMSHAERASPTTPAVEPSAPRRGAKD